MKSFDISTNNEGFLNDASQWDPAVTEAMASVDGLTLTEQHWEIIKFLRQYYDLYEIAPDARILMKSYSKHLGLTGELSKKYLASLFPEKPAETACRYAGLPNPVIGACG